MKKLSLLLIAFLSTSMLFAQSKELATNPEMLPMSEIVVQTDTDTDSNNLSISDYSAEDDVATKKHLEENAKKSKIAKEKRDKQTEAVRKRLQKSENTKTQKAQQKKNYKNMELDANGNPLNNNNLKTN